MLMLVTLDTKGNGGPKLKKAWWAKAGKKKSFTKWVRGYRYGV
jgi:hypothetical protein